MTVPPATFAPLRPAGLLHATLAPDQSGAPPHSFVVEQTDAPLSSVVIIIRQPSRMQWHPAPAMQEADATSIFRYWLVENNPVDFEHVEVSWEPQPEGVRVNQLLFHARGTSLSHLQRLAQGFHDFFSQLFSQRVEEVTASLDAPDRTEVIQFELVGRELNVTDYQRHEK